MRKSDLRAFVRKTFIVAMALFWMAGAVPAYAGTSTGPNILPNKAGSGETGFMDAMGMSTTQPSRYAPSGGVIDKNTSNPLGRSMTVENQVLQLAGAGLYISGDPYDIYKKPVVDNSPLGLLPGIYYYSRLLNTSSSSTSDWYDVPKAMTGADIQGVGHDVVITAALPPILYTKGLKKGKDTGSCELELIVTDYNEGKPVTGSFVLVNSMPEPVDYNDRYNSCIKVAAGNFDHDSKNEDQVAIVVGNTLYFTSVSATVSTSSLTVTASILSQTTFDSSNSVANVSNTTSDYPAMDLVAADATGDNYKDLLVTTGSSNWNSNDPTPQLLIYSDTHDATKPTAKIPLQVTIPLQATTTSGSTATVAATFEHPNVAVGDVIEPGQRDIVIAGMTSYSGSTPYLAYADYNPDTEQFPASLSPAYALGSTDVASALAGLAVFSPDGLDGKPQDVAFGDQIYQYDGSSQFVDQTGIKMPYGYNDRYMLNMVTGNFDGNTTGIEEIAMLYIDHSSRGLKDQADLTWMNLTWKEAETSTDLKHADYPAICAPDVMDNGVKMVYGGAEFTFADPTVIAVLAPPPYYSELNYSDFGTTTIAKGGEVGSETTKSLETSVGVSVGFQVSVPGVYEAGIKNDVEASFTASWSKSKSIEKTVAYNNGSGSVDVVVSVTPYDVYFYREYDPTYPKGHEVSIQVPYAPITRLISLDDYNQLVNQYKIADAPVIDKNKVLGGATPGDPRTYPGSISDLPVSGSSSVLTGAGFVQSASQNNSVAEDIETQNETSKEFEFELKDTVSFDMTIADTVTVGGSVGAGYTHSMQTTDASSTKFSCDPAMPSEADSNYQFTWELVAYNYTFTVGQSPNQSTQTAVVLNCLVQPNNTFLPPGGLKVVSVTPTSAKLQWAQVSGASGYVLQRSSSASGSYTPVQTLTGDQTTSCTDSSLQPDKTYYYEVSAYAAGPPSVDGAPCNPVAATTLPPPSPVTLTVDFEVGSTDHATALVANEPLKAVASIQNNQGASQTVLFVTTLYDSNGAMIGESSKTLTIAANATGTTTDSLTLPANAASCSVAAFVLDGGSLASSKLVRLSNVVKLPS